MAASSDATVRRALAADLLKLPGGLGCRPAPASLVDGKLLDALQRCFGARIADVFRLVGGRLSPNGEPAANAAVRLAGV